jgi:hypothetical protein
LYYEITGFYEKHSGGKISSEQWCPGAGQYWFTTELLNAQEFSKPVK